jgi:hypothetical protein
MFTCVAHPPPDQDYPLAQYQAHLDIRSYRLALQDLCQGLFGAHRDVLEEHKLMYRPDVSRLSPSTLKAVTMTRKAILTYPVDIPRLRYVIESVKVWLSFDKDKLVQVSFSASQFG